MKIPPWTNPFEAWFRPPERPPEPPPKGPFAEVRAINTRAQFGYHWAPYRLKLRPAKDNAGFMFREWTMRESFLLGLGFLILPVIGYEIYWLFNNSSYSFWNSNLRIKYYGFLFPLCLMLSCASVFKSTRIRNLRFDPVDGRIHFTSRKMGIMLSHVSVPPEDVHIKIDQLVVHYNRVGVRWWTTSAHFPGGAMLLAVEFDKESAIEFAEQLPEQLLVNGVQDGGFYKGYIWRMLGKKRQVEQIVSTTSR